MAWDAMADAIGMPLTVLSALGIIHFTLDQPYTAKFFELSYYNPSNQQYSKGADDWPFVATFVLLFTFLRAFLMRFVFNPFFNYFAPRPTERTATRFAEQAWSAAYYTVSFSVGLYIAYSSPYWSDYREVWGDYPQKESDGLFKAYYLIETAFWVQQVIVLNIEERRKDFVQMLCHHFVTCALIFLSYAYNVTKVGNAILCIMDFSDILLSVLHQFSQTDVVRKNAEVS
jgi:very-long-chain ceramide synthase